MEGMGSIEDQDKTVDSRFQILQALDCSNLGYTKHVWRNAVPPLCNCWSGISVSDYFGRTMADSLPDSIKIGIVQVAVGGCDIRLFDKNLYQDYDSTYTESWFTDKIAAYNGNPYEFLINLAKLAQEDGVIKGILLHQGETNTGDTQWPSYVDAIYNAMMTDLSLDPTSVPLLAGEVVHSDQGGVCASMNDIIDQLPEAITTAHVISSSGCTVSSDNIHFNTAGYREMGKRYAEKMLSLLKKNDTETKSIPLKKGWNLIGCPFPGNTSIESALASIWEELDTVKNNDSIYLKNGSPTLNSLTHLEWSKGYCIKVANDCTLTW